MKHSQAKLGRVFVVRLEHGDVVHESIEDLAREQSIRAATLIFLGGADTGSKLVVGPEDGAAQPVNPMELALDGVHEVAGTGTIFPDENGNPSLHAHLACGREHKTTTGCIRRGVRTWRVMEVVISELVDSPARRVHDPKIGFSLLQP